MALRTRRPYGVATAGAGCPWPLAPQPATMPLEAARRASFRSFWSLLADFEALSCAPASWVGSRGPAHPFFFSAGGRIQLPLLDRLSAPPDPRPPFS